MTRLNAITKEERGSKMKRKILRISLAAVAIMFVFSASAQSQGQFPTKNITMYCGVAAGGGTDAVGRQIGMEMEKRLGKPVVVVNKTGGGGLVAVKAMLADKPDGHSIAIVPTMNHFIQKYLKEVTSWVDPLKELQCLGFVNRDIWGIAVKSNAPFNTIAEFIKYLKDHPGSKVSDAGVGTTYHWGWEKFMNQFGVKVTTIAYPGTADALKALAGGELLAASTAAPEAAPLLGTGLIKVLGIAADERSPVYPTIPTFKEQGVNFLYDTNRCIVSAAGTPEPVVAKLSDAVKIAYQSESYQSFLKKTGYGGFYLNAKDGQKYFQELDELLKGLMANAGVLRK